MARSAAVGRKKKSTKPPKRKAEDVEDDHEDSGASATVQVSKMRWDHLSSGRELSRTWSYFSDIPEECKTETGCIMGIDEAGRGPVLGPMVYAVAFVPEDKQEELKSCGFDDSKKLNEDQRDTHFQQILGEATWMGWAVTALSPQDISSCMLQRQKYNLNELAHDTTMSLIRGVLDIGVKLTHVYVDTVGPPESYERKLSAAFTGIRFSVRKKADSLYPIVSAASICAKVTRDACLNFWEYPESQETGKGQSPLVFGTDFGCGYPSDSKTVAWLKGCLDPVFGFPSLIRFSWSTCSKMLEEKGISMEWEADQEEDAKENNNTIMNAFAQQPKKKRMRLLKKHFGFV